LDLIPKIKLRDALQSFIWIWVHGRNPAPVDMDDLLRFCVLCISYMGVSKNRGTPKWMVYKGKPYFKWMIWEETPLFLETPTCIYKLVIFSWSEASRKHELFFMGFSSFRPSAFLLGMILGAEKNNLRVGPYHPYIQLLPVAATTFLGNFGSSFVRSKNVDGMYPNSWD